MSESVVSRQADVSQIQWDAIRAVVATLPADIDKQPTFKLVYRTFAA